MWLNMRYLDKYVVYSLNKDGKSMHLLVHGLSMNTCEVIYSSCTDAKSFVGVLGSTPEKVDHNTSISILDKFKENVLATVEIARLFDFDIDSMMSIVKSVNKVNPIQITNKRRLSDILSQFSNETKD